MSLAGKERRDFISVIPDDLKLFEPADIKHVFNYLEKTFRLNRDWYADFKKELLKVERGMSEQEFFFRYTRQHIDPALQRILRRNDSVIIALARYLLRERIAEKKKEEHSLRDFYLTDKWKKGK
jgi:hypothetical protein